MWLKKYICTNLNISGEKVDRKNCRQFSVKMGPKLFFLPAKIAVGNLNKVARAAIFAVIIRKTFN